MASNFHPFSVKMYTLCSTMLILFLSNAVTAVPEPELESMLAVLRNRGYNLFGNAITTSDIYYEIIAGSSFTFFAPTDSSLFALDMTTTASDYIATLRYHVVPRRLSLADLRTIPSGSTLHTLLPGHDIQVPRRLVSGIITADGIDVVVPDLFYSREIAVHGLGGILSFRSPIGLRHGSSPLSLGAGHRHLPHPPANFFDDQYFGPPVVERHHDPPLANYTGNHGSPVIGHPHAPPPPATLSDPGKSKPWSAEGTDNRFVSPVPEPASFNPFSPADSPGRADSPVENSPAHGLSPESSTGPASPPSTEPSVPKADNQATPSPSIGDTHAGPGEGWTLMWPSTERNEVSLVGETEANNGVSSTSPLTMPHPREEAASGITGAETTTENPWPSDPETLDCPVRESETSLGQVIVQPGNPLTLQQFTMSTLTCARTQTRGKSRIYS